MLTEILSFLVFAISVTGLLGGFLAILTSPPLYLPNDKAKAEEEKEKE